jgi:regulator of protease activity HflC (stomatin/prohibitin superfamily)
MGPRDRLVRKLKYYGTILLAVLMFLGALVVLAIPAELHRQSIAADNTSRPDTPGLGWWPILDILPGVFAAGAAFLIASSFLASLYDLHSWRDGARHIWRCIFGQVSFEPYVRVEYGKINTERSSEILMRVGGPGSFLAYYDSAVILERGGRLTRVVGPGEFDYDLLEPFEKVHDVVDLRPMRWRYSVNALSKEGIPVTAYADVTFQVNTNDRKPSDEEPYPALKEAAFKASTCRWMRSPEGSEDDQYFDWVRRVIISNTEGSLRGIIARYPLNALIGLEPPPSSEESLPRETIQKELKEALQESCASLGAQINEVRLGEIQVSDEVAQQWIKAWKNQWQSWAMVQEKAGEATREQLQETAKAQAQVDIITAVSRAFQQSVARDARIPPQLLVMRLIEVFGRSAIEPYTRLYLPREAMETLDQLRDLISKEPAELEEGL